MAKRRPAPTTPVHQQKWDLPKNPFAYADPRRGYGTEADLVPNREWRTWLAEGGHKPREVEVVIVAPEFAHDIRVDQMRLIDAYIAAHTAWNERRRRGRGCRPRRGGSTHRGPQGRVPGLPAGR